MDYGWLVSCEYLYYPGFHYLPSILRLFWWYMKILTMYWWIHLFYFWKFNIVYYLKIWSQEWLETNESSSLLATLYKALDEVCLY